MNYHIMASDKFIDNFINDIYEIGEKENNVFWIRGTKVENRYISNVDKVEWVGYDQKFIEQKLLTSVKGNDKVVIHWYDMAIGETILKLPHDVQVYAVHWGGDFFEDPIEYHKNWLYEKKTKRLLQLASEVTTGNKITKIFSKKSRIASKTEKKEAKRLFLSKAKQVQRIDYILIHEANKGDLELTKKMYNHWQVKTKANFYDLNFDLAVSSNASANTKKNKEISILVGNSATYACNHLDAFEKLSHLPGKFNIVCQLSYGNDEYKKKIIKEGINIFGDRFIFISDFLPREDYIDLLNSVDIFFFYHNRSQALGNIVSAITLGKPVFLRKKNTLTEFFKRLGIPVYDADKIATHDLEKLILNSTQLKADQQSTLHKSFSKESRLNQLRAALT